RRGGGEDHRGDSRGHGVDRDGVPGLIAAAKTSRGPGDRATCPTTRPTPAGGSRLLDSRQPSSTEVPMRLIWLAVVVALSLPFAPLATGAQQPRSADSRPFRPEELEQIVAPIVQYPDPLLAQIFMASTYPLEVIQAARFAKANPRLTGRARRWIMNGCSGTTRTS